MRLIVSSSSTTSIPPVSESSRPELFTVVSSISITAGCLQIKKGLAFSIYCIKGLGTLVNYIKNDPQHILMRKINKTHLYQLIRQRFLAKKGGGARYKKTLQIKSPSPYTPTKCTKICEQSVLNCSNSSNFVFVVIITST